MPWVDESSLDDPDALRALDTRDSLRSLASAGAQVRRAIVSAQEAGASRVSGGERPRSVLVAALGGSSLVCDVLDLLAEPGSPVPVTTRRDAPLPGLGRPPRPRHRGLAVRPRGRPARPRGRGRPPRRVAPHRRCGRLPLADVCARARGVHVDVALPTPSSRTALWSMLTPVLVAADALGLVQCPVPVLERVADVLDEVAEECRPSSEAFVNPAKVLATGLGGTVPVVLGDGPLSGVAAARAASMLARTARVPATHGSLPDAASQVVACLDGPFGSSPTAAGGSAGGTGDIFADPYLDAPPTPRLGLLALRDPDLPPDAVALADAVVASARESGVTVFEQEARSGEPVERLASLVALTDFTATYLALGLGLDPSVSRHVAELRDRTS